MTYTDDTLLAGQVRLRQSGAGHRAGTDAVLLAAAVPDKGVLVDAGAGSGAVGLMACRADKSRPVWFIERDAAQADLARFNAADNGLTAARVVTGSLFDAAGLAAAGLAAGRADCVATNPPYLEKGRARVAPDPGRAAARVMDGGTLEGWLNACIRLLKPDGRLVLIHRAERIAELLRLITPPLGGVRLRFIHPLAGRAATRVVLTAGRRSKAPLIVAPPLVLHEAGGGFTAEARALHDGTARLFD
ncbi:MAG: methyltransferase [Methylobacteriaceae bacterium]|jgi:tRNA1(Val) A37 N6-methylase TrmN6|nr:methyltransferase [Methylobacteriaceae bacterium]